MATFPWLADAKAALKESIKRAGGQIALAQKIGCTQSRVSQWLNDTKRGVTAEFVTKIEEATGVERWRLRPDLYQAPLPAAPEPARVGE